MIITDRGASEVIGFILLTALVISGVTVIFAVGGDDIDGAKDNIEKENVMQSFEQIDAAVYNNGIDERSIEMGTQGYDGQMNKSEGSTVTFMEKDSSGSTSVINSYTMETVEYDGSDYKVVYEGSAIWLVQDSQYIEEKSPQVTASEQSLNFSIESGERIFDGIKSDSSDLVIEIEGDSYKAWSNHFEDEAAKSERVSHTVNDDAKTTSLVVEGTENTTTTNSGPSTLDPSQVITEYEGSSEVDFGVPDFYDDKSLYAVCTTEITVSHTDNPDCREDYFIHGAGISGADDADDTMLTSVVPDSYDGGDLLFGGVTYETGTEAGQSGYEQSTPIFVDNGDVNVAYDGNLEEIGPASDSVRRCIILQRYKY